MVPGLHFSRHALRRMAGRHISPAEVEEAWASRNTTYARLVQRAKHRLVILGTTAGGRRLKVVVLARDERHVVTVAPIGTRRDSVMRGMLIQYDTEVGAYYAQLGTGEVARTVHVSDQVMVDVEADGQVHGIELLCPPGHLGDTERTELITRFPAAEQALSELQRIMPLPA
ncbi:MAG: DUF4258 domain-containing protein [Acidimicrobiia bacterium]